MDIREAVEEVSSLMMPASPSPILILAHLSSAHSLSGFAHCLRFIQWKTTHRALVSFSKHDFRMMSVLLLSLAINMLGLHARIRAVIELHA
mmetsp:Transcript_29097/g.72558  ORF Transcript_29097/g.72558 Transcript_29097/m.72558 type:complete len:91 (+) Transcript_29097:270-542(+)